MTGIVASFVCAFFSASKDLVSKRLSFDLKGIHSAFASFAFALPFYLVVMPIVLLLDLERLILTPTFFVLVILRSITDSVAEWSKMSAFEYADISIISSFLSTAPLFLLITSPLITGDMPSREGVIGVLLIVAGSLFLVRRIRKSEEVLPKKGIALALLAAFFFSLNNCFDRLAVQEAGPVQSAFAMTLLSAVILFPFTLRKRGEFATIRSHIRNCTLRGFMEISFMVSKLFALQYLQAPYVIGIQKSSLLLSIAGGRLFFKEGQMISRMIAGALILLGIILIVAAG